MFLFDRSACGCAACCNPIADCISPSAAVAACPTHHGQFGAGVGVADIQAGITHLISRLV
jgi:hypothetical protein